MTFYVTKHALTAGVEEIEAEVLEHALEMIRSTGPSKPRIYYCDGGQWHRTRDGAVAKANQMRENKIKSLRRQIERLEGLVFE